MKSLPGGVIGVRALEQKMTLVQHGAAEHIYAAIWKRRSSRTVLLEREPLKHVWERL